MASTRRLALMLAVASSFPLAAAASAERRALFWLMPYGNVTSVEGYASMWAQWGNYWRPGYVAAASAYALKHDGSLGYANTTAGEGLYGDIMEQYGFPALRQLNMTTLAMIYFTHADGLRVVLQDPQPFVDAVVDTVVKHGLHGADMDYEPQGAAAVAARLPAAAWRHGDPVAAFFTLLGDALAARGLLLTVDVDGGCPDRCGGLGSIGNLTQLNTEDTFGIRSLQDLQTAAAADAPTLSGKWAPGFEPGNLDAASFHDCLVWAAGEGAISQIATWQVHENNVGPQPTWFFDAVNAFLDAPAAEA